VTFKKSFIDALVCTLVIGLALWYCRASDRLDPETMQAIYLAISITWGVFAMRWSLLPRCAQCGSARITIYGGGLNPQSPIKAWYHCDVCNHRGSAPSS